ncbi:uncharacterized protein LOC126909025 [Daktulosphaira vitifoliae]|uniref:uncharacterized protein LOC126909025 n=1 Tax=Daktulosphaira vitifoliae TaxID=58002 RepID=UPI0021A9DD13|nr:uncharacterized protein LOC126909025 [Daktulosphaira vitifoliae]
MKIMKSKNTLYMSLRKCMRFFKKKNDTPGSSKCSLVEKNTSTKKNTLEALLKTLEVMKNVTDEIKNINIEIQNGLKEIKNTSNDIKIALEIVQNSTDNIKKDLENLMISSYKNDANTDIASESRKNEETIIMGKIENGCSKCSLVENDTTPKKSTTEVLLKDSEEINNASEETKNNSEVTKIISKVIRNSVDQILQDLENYMGSYKYHGMIDSDPPLKSKFTLNDHIKIDNLTAASSDIASVFRAEEANIMENNETTMPCRLEGYILNYPNDMMKGRLYNSLDGLHYEFDLDDIISEKSLIHYSKTVRFSLSSSTPPLAIDVEIMGDREKAYMENNRLVGYLAWVYKDNQHGLVSSLLNGLRYDFLSKDIISAFGFLKRGTIVTFRLDASIDPPKAIKIKIKNELIKPPIITGPVNGYIRWYNHKAKRGSIVDTQNYQTFSFDLKNVFGDEKNISYYKDVIFNMGTVGKRHIALNIIVKN